MKVARIVSMVMVFVMVTLTLQSWVASGEYEIVDQEVNLLGDPNLFSDDKINIYDAPDEGDKTAIARWNADLGDQIPKGVYYGPLFEVTAWKYNYNNPVAILPQDDLTDIITNDKYYVVGMNLHMFIDETIIMNGASEFWIDIPVKPDEDVLIFFDNDWAYWPNSIMSVHSPISTTDTVGTFQYVQGRYVNGHFYARGDIPVMPSIDIAENNSYPITVTFVLPFINSHPTFYLSQEMLGRPENDLDYRWIFGGEEDTYMRLDGRFADNEIQNRTWYDSFVIYNSRDYTNPVLQYSTNIDEEDYIYLPYDFSFGYSIIFTEGIGTAGCIGVQESFKPGEYLYFVHEVEVDTSTTPDSYLSIYLPFISTEKMRLRQVKVQLGLADFDDTTDTDIMSWTTDTYADFLLLSTSKKLDVSSISGGGIQSFYAYITITLDNTWNGTFLMYLRSDESAKSYFRVYKYGETTLGGTSISAYYAIEYAQDLLLQNSVWLTSGQWAQISTYSDGMVYVVRYFPVEMYTGTNIFYVTVKNETQTIKVKPIDYWELAMKEFRSIGVKDWKMGKNFAHLGNGLKYAFQAIVQKLWSFGETVWGWIQTGLTAIAEKLYELGEFIWHYIQEFIGILQDVVNFVREKIVPLLSVFFLLAIAWMAVLTIGLGSKAILYIGGEA